MILAGGSGSRLGADVPKQFLEIDGRTILEYSVEVFDEHPGIDAIAIITREDYIDKVRDIVARRGYRKVEKIFHDAVRPLVSRRIIDDCLAAMERYDAVDVAFNTTDTIIQVDSDNCISSIPDRNFLRNGQTPQVFRRSLIAEAYKIALQDSAFRTTDDCGVVLRYLPNEPIYVVPGEARNMKVTFKEDIGQIQHLMQMLKKQRVGQ